MDMAREGECLFDVIVTVRFATEDMANVEVEPEFRRIDLQDEWNSGRCGSNQKIWLGFEYEDDVSNVGKKVVDLCLEEVVSLIVRDVGAGFSAIDVEDRSAEIVGQLDGCLDKVCPFAPLCCVRCDQRWLVGNIAECIRASSCNADYVDTIVRTEITDIHASFEAVLQGMEVGYR